MTHRSIAGVFSAGVLVGALAFVLVQRVSRPSAPDETMDPGMSVGVGSPDQIAALRAEYEERISVLTAEKEALEELASKPEVGLQKSELPAPVSAEESRKRSEERKQYAKEARRKRDIENLLAAGYSMDRIDYLQRRAEELAAQFRKSKTDQMDKGVWPLDPKKDLVLSGALTLDPDFALKYEIGEAEYERYLEALKRPHTLSVDSVPKGSIADNAGIMPGDEVITYNNERIFNFAQLQTVSMAGPTDIAGVLVPVTVRRDGQTRQLMVPKGSLGIPLSGLMDLFVPLPPPPPSPN